MNKLGLFRGGEDVRVEGTTITYIILHGLRRRGRTDGSRNWKISVSAAQQ